MCLQILVVCVLDFLGKVYNGILTMYLLNFLTGILAMCFLELL